MRAGAEGLLRLLLGPEAIAAVRIAAEAVSLTK
jgi:hypothetical protein